MNEKSLNYQSLKHNKNCKFLLKTVLRSRFVLRSFVDVVQKKKIINYFDKWKKKYKRRC